MRPGVPLPLLLAALVLLGGCGVSPSRGRGLVLHEAQGGSGEVLEEEPSADLFQRMQEASGLAEESRHPAGAVLSTNEARQLLGVLVRTPVTQRNLAPRHALTWLLGEVLAGGEPVEYAELWWRAQRFGPLVWVRPDGYLVGALTGTPLQRLGPLTLEAGEWKVGRLFVGDFYFSREGVFYPVNEALRCAGGPPLAELGVSHPLNAAMDGIQDALGEMATALGRSCLHPLRTAEELSHLPSNVARLIAASPEYFARYGGMSREEQIREAARLSTHLLMMRGAGALGAAGGLGGWGAELPMLSLTAEGGWVMGGVVVAGGTMTAAVSVDLGALSLLHMAAPAGGGGGNGNAGQKAPQTPSSPGPGKWIYKTPTTQSPRALDYQEQVTGQPAWRVYQVGGTEFDGFKGKLLEAKGRGYKNFLKKDGTAQPWFKTGLRSLLEQADRQSQIAKPLNIPVEWHVAEEEFANFLRKAFRRAGFKNITVVYTPPSG